MCSASRRISGCCVLAFCLWGVVCGAVGLDAQETTTLTTAAGGNVAIVTRAAPIFLLPDANRQPLRVAREGSRLRVIEQTSGWVNVQFQDPQFGLRTGYIESRFVSVERRADLQPTDLSVPDSPRSPEVGAASTPPALPQRAGAETPGANAAPARFEQVDRGIERGVRSTSDGFFIGGGIEGNGLLSTEGGFNSATDSGSGFGVVLGYGFNRSASLYAGFSGARMTSTDLTGTYGLGHFDLGTRVHFRSGAGRVVPFVQAGLAGRAISANLYTFRGSYDVAASGAGVSFGGGLNAHFTPSLAFSGHVTWMVGNFSKYEVDGVQVPGGSISATSARVHLGLVWFPRGRGRRSS